MQEKLEMYETGLSCLYLALLAFKDFKIPFFHLLYEGNKNDLSLFPAITEELVKRYKLFRESCKKITIVFDKGNNSEKNIKG